MGGADTHKKAAVTFTLYTPFPADANSPFADARLWVGWANNADPDAATEFFSVGWDTGAHENLIVKQRVNGGSVVTTNTGIARPSGHTFWAPELLVTIVGPEFSAKALKGNTKYRVILYSNPASSAVKVLDQEFTDLGAITGSNLFMQVTTLAAQAKSLTANRVEVFSIGGTAFGYH